MKWRAEILALVLLALGAAGCRQEMADQPAYRPLQYSDFWGDARSERDPALGTVARPAQGRRCLFTGCGTANS
jgi:hypothetical protein